MKNFKKPILTIVYFLTSVFLFAQRAQCAGNNLLSSQCAGNNLLSSEERSSFSEEGEGGSSLKENPLSKFKPSKESDELLKEFLKKKIKIKNTFSPSPSNDSSEGNQTLIPSKGNQTLIPSKGNQTLIHGSLNSMSNAINQILVEEGYHKINECIVQPLVFELKNNLYENLDPYSACVAIQHDLFKKDKESLLYKSLISTGYLKKKKKG